MDDIRDILTFVEVARTQSFRKAGEALGLPTSSVSRRIASLEKRFGMQLVHRTTRQVKLTSAGEQLLVEAGNIVHEFKDALADSLSRVRKMDRRLRITTPIDFGTTVLLPLFHSFNVLHPEVRFEFTLTSDRLDLVRDRIDLALRFGTLEDSRLVARRIASIRRGLYASQELLESQPELDHPRSLDAYPLIAMPLDELKGHWTLYRGNQSVEVPLVGRVVANTVGAVRQLACLGAGIAVLDHAFVTADVAEGRLRHILPRWSLEPLPLYAVTTSRTHSPLMSELIAYLTKGLEHR